MKITTKFYSMEINDEKNMLTSFCTAKKEFLRTSNAVELPLFRIALREFRKDIIELTSLQAKSCKSSVEESGEYIIVTLEYFSLGNMQINALVNIKCNKEKPLTYWNITVDNKTELLLEWIIFPDIAVPGDLVAAGGTAKLLWPAMEGVLIEDIEWRENDEWLKYKPMNYPNRGWEGYYPGPCQSQFMAYYSDEGGLYVGAHDKESITKSIEFYKDGDGIRLEFKAFPGAVAKGEYALEYDMVLGLFEGDWHDAAEIYRSWLEESNPFGLKKLVENPRICSWLKESPVVMIYPVRGTRDTGDMTPNEYFPYINALPYVNKYSDAFQSKVMALMMHWEGTAPWAPPYVWPPFGGEGVFKEFVDKVHQSNNLVGVYCSGMGWTNESNTDKSYTMRKIFEEKNLESVMCAAPDGSVPNSLICNGEEGQRWGHDMCPANDFVKETVVNEVKKVVNAGLDYGQYFDQNLGGASYLCYSDKHGHPPAPGKWQRAEMRKLLADIDKVLEDSGRKTVIGCEAAAAEPYMEYLYFNDLRNSINLFIGKPIPLYTYLFHEYTCNFMGNQYGSTIAIHSKKTPFHLLFRLAYAFISGDYLTITLKDKGLIHWDWGTSWESDMPAQEPVIELIRNLNSWRRGNACTFLFSGKMLKPFDIKVEEHIELVKGKGGGSLRYPALLASRWQNSEGRIVQILVNIFEKEQRYTLCNLPSEVNAYKLFANPDQEHGEKIDLRSGVISGSVPALSAIMIEFLN